MTVLAERLPHQLPVRLGRARAPGVPAGVAVYLDLRSWPARPFTQALMEFVAHHLRVAIRQADLVEHFDLDHSLVGQVRIRSKVLPHLGQDYGHWIDVEIEADAQR